MRFVLHGAVTVWVGIVLLSVPEARSPQESSTVMAGPADVAMFAPSTECLACHNNLMAPTGEDVSIGASWRGSMMANAARDPYFHGSVRREVMDHPLRAADIEDECSACHMPTSNKIARAAGGHGEIFAHLPIADRAGASAIETMAADGITCTVCHQVAPDGLGTRERFNGNFAVAAPLPNGSRQAFGPFEVDAGRRRIMHSVTGFDQVAAPHIRESELCAACHMLITEAFGPDGSVIGSLPEQMNYQEWRHSAFFDEQRSCQSCHMPVVDGPVRVASVLGEYRDTLSRHTFLGGNAFMLRLLNRFRTELGVVATAAELEATARATVRQLQTETATLSVDEAAWDGASLAFDVVVTNLTGHKFPTGYPSRRTWLHVTARDEAGALVFESGRVTETGLIEGNDNDEAPETFEPHYEQISAPEEVQIYEAIMGTPANTPTTGLLQAVQYLKDSRLLPRGFDKDTADAEIAVYGGAATDGDFAGGSDRVRYRVPIDSNGAVTVEVALRYQPISFRWAQNLASYDAPEPRQFVTYYDTLAATSSEVVAQTSVRLTP